MNVVIPEVPTRSVLAMIEHLDDVIRELALISVGADSGTAVATVPTDVLHAMGQVRPVLYVQKESISRQAGRAWRAGEPTMDVVVDLEASASGTVLEVLDVFEAVDAAAVGDGALLLPASPPEVATFRRWFFRRLAAELRDRAEP